MKSWADFRIQLPPGASGEVATTCPECSSQRKKHPNAKCLSVNTEKLVWICFHCNWSGTLKSGVDRTSERKPKPYVRPTYAIVPPPDPVLVWCANRGLTPETAHAFGLTFKEAYFNELEDYAPAVCFPFYRGDECINVKFRALDQKAFQQIGGAEKIFFNLNACLNQTEAYITEGEPDAMACWQAGIPAMSVPDGAPSKDAKKTDVKFDYLLTCHDELEPLTKIVLALDNDEPGQKLAQELARRIGYEKIWTVTWPEGCKDANHVLEKYGEDILRMCLQNATPWPIDDLVTLSDLSAGLVGATEPPPRLTTGWAKLDALWGWSSTMGRLILVSGWPSHGKSEWTDSLVLNSIQHHQWPWLICSPENMPIEDYAQRMIERETGEEYYSLMAAERQASIDRLDPYLYLLNPDDMIPIETVLKAARALVLRPQGLRGILIDPWNEFDHARQKDLSETDYTAVMLGKLRRFARNYGVQIIVIAHPAKLTRNKDGTFPKPTPRDVSGSAHWYNKPDDCLMVWRDASGETQSTQAEIHVQKVRGKRMGTHGQTELFWSYRNGRYTDVFEGH